MTDGAPPTRNCGPVPTTDARAPEASAKVETCSGCGYCEPEKNLHCPSCCDFGIPF